MYDGFYAVVTNLDGDVRKIININKRRWEIEENFRIMKTEFEARPVFVRREDSIKAHFITCYISLPVYRLLEKKLTDALHSAFDFRTDYEFISKADMRTIIKKKTERIAQAQK